MESREPSLEEMKQRVCDYYEKIYHIKFRSDLKDEDIIDLYHQLKKFGMSVARYNVFKELPPNNLIVLRPELEK